MGRAIAAELAGMDDVRLAGEADQGDDVRNMVGACDIVIDFSAPAALEATLAACRHAGRPLVVGTTGLGRRITR